MATIRQFICATCKPANAGNLFEALKKVATDRALPCPRCGKHLRLRLKFNFGLNATDSDCTVIAALLPRRREKWRDENSNPVEYYPFFVFLKRHGRETAFWFPYWHLVTTKRRTIRKYGQWAPFMDYHLFRDLLRQARQRGII